MIPELLLYVSILKFPALPGQEIGTTSSPGDQGLNDYDKPVRGMAPDRFKLETLNDNH